ncbi:MAG: acyl carrier protein [Desulfobaccales bacterium]|nr:acyl carrier protein [Desulfobaccales bacterium]
MNHEEAYGIIREALKKTLGGKSVTFSDTTDLVEENILDSLDGMVFLLALEELSGREIPEEGDLVEAGFFKVEGLVKFLTANP